MARRLLLFASLLLSPAGCGGAPPTPGTASELQDATEDAEGPGDLGRDDGLSAGDPGLADEDLGPAEPGTIEATPDEALEGEDARLDEAAAPGDLLDAGGPEDPGPLPPLPDVEPGCVEGEPCALQWSGPCDQGLCDSQGACVGSKIPGCCLADSECAAPNPQGVCDEVRCISYACVTVLRPGCCTSAAACDDGFPCTEDSCALPAGHCVHCPEACTCPTSPPLLDAGFDAPNLYSLAFTVSSLGAGGAVTWQISTARALSPPSAAYMGRPTCPTYYNGSVDESCQPADPAQQDSLPVHLVLRTPYFTLPAMGAGQVASFWIWADVQPPVGGLGEPDVLSVLLEDAASGMSWPLASSLALGKDTGGLWKLMTVDLSPWRGKLARLAFDFDTFDGKLNHFEGIYLDDLRVVDRCQGGCCAVDEDCAPLDPPDPCRKPRCVALTDGAGAVCMPVPKNPGAPCMACSDGAQCADADPCTQDLCGAGGTCTHTAFCCFEEVAWSEGFEAGLGGWFVEDPSPLDGVSWQTTGTQAIEGGSSAWFGNPASGTYAAISAVSGKLRSAVMTLPTPSGPGGQVALRFWLALTTEWGNGPYVNPTGIDRLSLQVLTGGEATEAWSSDAVDGATGGIWVPVSVPLGAWAGQPVQLVFVFDSADEVANAFAGPFLDALAVGVFCGP